MPYVERISDQSDSEYDEYENAFPDPNIGINEYVWRYLSIEQFISLFKSSKLYFSRADRMADEFEGTIPKGENLDEDVEQIYKKWRRLVHLNCWNVNNTESMVMWEFHAPKGVAIRSTLDHLLRSLDSEADFTIHLGEVKYINFSEDKLNLIDYGDDSRSGNLFEPFQYKREYFTEEREIRIMTNPLADLSRREELKGTSIPPSELEDMQERALLVDINLSELIEEVVVHPNARGLAFNSIKTVAERTQGLGDRVHRSSIKR